MYVPVYILKSNIWDIKWPMEHKTTHTNEIKVFIPIDSNLQTYPNDKL